MNIRDPKRPVFTISIAAELLGVHPRTLRIYEEEGLICPQRRGLYRLYSDDDIDRIQEIIDLIHKRHLNLAGIKTLMDMAEKFHLEVENLFDELLGGD